MGWLEVVAVIVVDNASLVMVVFELGDRIWMDKITNKQVSRAARRGGLYEPSLGRRNTWK
jgi:hypothetical protein